MTNVFQITIAVLLQIVLTGAGAQKAFQRGLMALKENHLKVALGEFTRAERENPNNAQIHNFRGITLAKIGENEAAVKEYREAIRLDPRAADACTNLGYLEWTRGRFDHARQALEKALKIDPKDRYARYYLGRVELEQGHYHTGLKNLEHANVPLPEEPDFLLKVAADYLAIHQEPQAQQVLSRLQGLQLNDRQDVRLGSLLLSAHQSEQALLLFRRLDVRCRGLFWARFDLALANLKAGKLRAATSVAASLASRDEAALPWTLLGIAHARLKESQQAIAAFRRAATLDPGHEGCWLDLTRELMESGDSAGAISAAQEGLAHIPQSYALRVRLGAAYMQAGHYKKAEGVFRKLIDMGDPTPISAIGLAQVLLRTGRPREAAQELALTEHKLGTNFLLVYFQGIAMAHAGQPNKAVVMFREAVHLNPHNAEAFRWLGAMELQLRQTSNAICDLQEALRLDNANVRARRLLVQACAMAHKPHCARQYLRQNAETTIPEPADKESAGFQDPPWEMPKRPLP